MRQTTRQQLRGGIGAGQRTRALSTRQQADTIKPQLLQGGGQTRRIELRIGNAQRCTSIHQDLCVTRLMIINCMRIRHEYGGQSGSGQF